MRIDTRKYHLKKQMIEFYSRTLNFSILITSFFRKKKKNINIKIIQIFFSYNQDLM